MKTSMEIKKQTEQVIRKHELTSVLTEDTRAQLVNASRNAGNYKNTFRGKNRWERKKFSKVSTKTQQFNTINMNTFFKSDLLEVDVPVTGETDDYKVTVQIDSLCEEIAKNIKNNNNIFEYKCIIQALTKLFNSSNIRLRCSCADFKFSFDHWSIVNNWGTADSANDPGPGKGIRNPNNDKGKGCKHCLIVLSNQDWLMRVANVIRNYILYMAEHKQKLFLKFIFPKLYNTSADAAVESDLVGEETDLETDHNLIEVINDWARNKGKIKKGSNINPVAGKNKLSGPEGAEN